MSASPSNSSTNTDLANRFPGNSRRYANRKQDFAFAHFNVSAGEPLTLITPLLLTPLSLVDLTPLFNWNTKQLFLYVQAEYLDAKGVKNEVVIWDKIVRSKEQANLSIAGRNKYVFRNLATTFK